MYSCIEVFRTRNSVDVAISLRLSSGSSSKLLTNGTDPLIAFIGITIESFLKKGEHVVKVFSGRVGV